MAKRILQSDIRLPEHPRVRFFVKDTSTSVKDITKRVTRVAIEDLEDGEGTCQIVRMDERGRLVWKTRHCSIEEAKWHAEFEYDLSAESWEPVPAEK